MKCYTVTEKGVTAGIQLAGKKPYPHVCVGDPDVPYDHRRVEVDAALAGDDALTSCSMTIDMKEEDRRRASYKLVPPDGKDDDKALVKFETRVDGARTWYDFPRDTRSLAKGWLSKTPRGPRVSTPVELVVLKKNDKAQVYKEGDVAKPPVPVFTVSFDGKELKTS